MRRSGLLDESWRNVALNALKVWIGFNNWVWAAIGSTCPNFRRLFEGAITACNLACKIRQAKIVSQPIKIQPIIDKSSPIHYKVQRQWNLCNVLLNFLVERWKVVFSFWSWRRRPNRCSTIASDGVIIVIMAEVNWQLCWCPGGIANGWKWYAVDSLSWGYQIVWKQLN